MSEPDDVLVPGEEFTAEEIALLEQLGEEALNDPRPRRTPAQVEARLRAAYEETLRSRRALG